MERLDLIERPQCPLCGKGGRLVYAGIEDVLYGCPGKWDIVACEDMACGLYWLSPMPLGKNIEAAYLNYYTHGESAVSMPFPERLANWLFQRLDRVNERLLGLGDERIRFAHAYLDETPPGRLLDVGCGSGLFLKKMQSLGWTVEGTDFDPEVLAVLSSSGIKVSIGELADIGHQSASFDAITLRHVIEHVENPVDLLKECWRLLKPQGRLILTTPNIASYGHCIYRNKWRGLEPPRHLHLFSIVSLGRVAESAGIKRFKLSSTAQGASYMFRESEKLLLPESRFWTRFLNLILWFWVWQFAEIRQIRRHGKEMGEELVFVATKSCVPE